MLKRKARLSKSTIKKLVEYFGADISATQASKLAKVNRNTANIWFNNFREEILKYQENENDSFCGEVELDESYFGGPKKKIHTKDRTKRGRGAENKVPVFGIKKREDGKVYTQIIKNASKSELLPIIRKLVSKKNTTIYTDKWRSYDGLVLDGYKHKRINHSKQYSDRKGNHVNGIENFWSFSKRRLAKFNGVSRKTFLLHLKECEFRYNHKSDILRVLKELLIVR